MTLRTLIAAAAMLGALPILTAAAPAPPAAQASARISITPIGGHLMGNPAARTKIVEYASYTCPHCAVFDAEGLDAIRGDYVRSGLASFELRNLIRDPLDFTAAMLARCGTPAQFFDNHHLIMRNQTVWLSAAQTATPETRNDWFEGSITERMGKIARGTGLYRLMQTRGFTAAQLDACLADEQGQKTVAEMSEGGQKLGVKGTPSFLLNGKLLADVYNWAALKPLLPKAKS